MRTDGLGAKETSSPFSAYSSWSWPTVEERKAETSTLSIFISNSSMSSFEYANSALTIFSISSVLRFMVSR